MQNTIVPTFGVECRKNKKRYDKRGGSGGFKPMPPYSCSSWRMMPFTYRNQVATLLLFPYLAMPCFPINLQENYVLWIQRSVCSYNKLDCRTLTSRFFLKGGGILLLLPSSSK